MELSLPEVFSIHGKSEVIEFRCPYLNDDKELAFRFSNFGGYDPSLPNMTYVFDEKRNGMAIRWQSLSKKTIIPLSETECKELLALKRKIMISLSKLNDNFLTGKEKVLVLDTGEEEFPFVFVSQTILDNAMYSPKYNRALVYSYNTKAKEMGVERSFEDHLAMYKELGQIFSRQDLSKLNKSQTGQDKSYVLSMEELVALS